VVTKAGLCHPPQNKGWSEERRLNASISHIGNKNSLGFHHTEETKKRWSEQRMGEHNSFFGKHHTIATRIKMSKSHKGHLWSEEAKKKASESHRGEKHHMFGKHHSEETKHKISIAQIGKKSFKFGKQETEHTKQKNIESHLGEKNAAWNGGSSFEPYTLDFNKRFKAAIRERDGCCMMCNIGFDDLHLLKRRISIHHIDYNKLNSFPQNCLTLCNNCHTVTNNNREHWTAFFHSMLSERYNYKYSQDQKVILDFTGDKK
jgi:hypothetical protein